MESLIYFLVVAGLFVLMMRLGCGAHVMGHGRHHGRSESRDSAGLAVTTQAKDPVCGMTVATPSAKSSLHQGAAYYFCSAACRDRFEASPGTYVKGRPASTQLKETEHGSHR